MRSSLSLLINCLSGKVIVSYIQVNQLHSDATSHKGTEIMNVILVVLTNNKKFRTVCLASYIIPEDGTAECHSAAIFDQLTECG